MNKKHPFYQEDIQRILQVESIGQLHGKRFLITGASGLIGVMLIDALMAMGDIQIYAVGRNKERARARLGEYFDNPRFTFIEQDVQQPFEETLQVDYILPGASNTHPLAYAQYPVETIMTNIKGTENALNLAEQCGATVLFLSTVEVYGNAIGQDVFTENYTGRLNLATSRSCYTESKRVSEAMCQSYMAEKRVKVKIVRLSRIFGPTLLASDSKASSQFIQRAVQGEDIVLKSEGNQYFSYTYVADAVAAILHILLHGNMGEAYNVSHQSCDVHLKDFAQLCASYNGKQVVFDLPSETERKGFSIAVQAIMDNSKLLSLGFQPQYTIENAIRRTIEILK